MQTVRLGESSTILLTRVVSVTAFNRSCYLLTSLLFAYLSVPVPSTTRLLSVIFPFYLAVNKQHLVASAYLLNSKSIREC